MLIGIVAHVRREHLVDSLIRETQPDVIRWDDGIPSVKGCADNHIRVLSEFNRQVSVRHRWCVVLEDDSRPVSDFRHQLDMALARAQTPLVGLYLGGGNLNFPTQRAMEMAVAKAFESHWITADWFCSGVAYAVRSTRLPALVTAISEMAGPLDRRINLWARKTGVQTWYAQPSLVNHKDGVSVISPNLRIPPRQAFRFGPRAEWNSSTTRMEHAEPWPELVLP
jgi:hypothetical protein